MEILYSNNNQQRTIVLFPGWASDARVFSRLTLSQYNVIKFNQTNPGTAVKELYDFLSERKINKVSIVGYSMGGFVAAAFAAKYFELVQELFLVSVRKKYIDQEVEGLKAILKKDPAKFLPIFYRACFNDLESFNWFKDTLLQDYCKIFTLDMLVKTLDYLAATVLDINAVAKIKKVTFFHGGADKIAPIEEAQALAEEINARFVVFKNSGHMLFCEEDINTYL